MPYLPTTADAVVIGAGVVGAACAFYLAEAGLQVVVVDRGRIAGGTTSSGEGNILVSDKELGPELELALYSRKLWGDLAEQLPDFEFEAKGGLVVATSGRMSDKLTETIELQKSRGIEVEMVDAASLADLEPRLTRDLLGAALYAQDAQVQPMLAAARLLAAYPERISVIEQCELTRIDRDAAGAVSGITTQQGSCATPIVVNAAGTWGGEVASLAGVKLPVLPRRGFILVTQPMGKVINHKVYTADYLLNVASDNAGLETSTVVEGTRSGTVLIGSSRERVGFDRSPNPVALSRLARGAIELFPFLADVKLIRTYFGFRPYCPDHLPVIGEDSRVPGLYHACGHEGAGIGLAPATAKLIADSATGQPLALSLDAFRPERFEVPVA